MTLTIDTDRIAESNRLLELAETFLIEATMWADPNVAGKLQRTAKHLAELGRGVLHMATSIEVAEAYADAGSVILGNVQGARRFFRTVLAEPHVPKASRR